MRKFSPESFAINYKYIILNIDAIAPDPAYIYFTKLYGG